MSLPPESTQLDDSPIATFLGIDQDAGLGGASCRVTIEDKHRNPNGTMHGGVMFTMFDLVMGIAVNAHLGPHQLCATSEVHIRYLRPVFGGSVVATAAVVSAGSRIVQLEARAVDDGGQLVATATGSFVVLERRTT